MYDTPSTLKYVGGWEGVGMRGMWVGGWVGVGVGVLMCTYSMYSTCVRSSQMVMPVFLQDHPYLDVASCDSSVTTKVKTNQSQGTYVFLRATDDAAHKFLVLSLLRAPACLC